MLEVENALRKIAARYKDGDGPEVCVPAITDVTVSTYPILFLFFL